MYIFGGRNNDDLNDLYKLDLESRTWEYVDATNAPTSRRRHSIGFVGRALFMFGGFDGSFYNDFHMLNIDPFVKPISAGDYF